MFNQKDVKSNTKNAKSTKLVMIVDSDLTVPNENCATAWQGTVTELVEVLVTVVFVLVVGVHESVFE